MEAKKSKKATIENQRGSWLLMGLVVALAFMFVSFEWTQHDVRVAALSSDDESIFVTELVPITFPDEKLEPPPPPENKIVEILEIVKNDIEVADNVSTVGEDMDATHKIVWIPPVVETEVVDEDVIVDVAEIMPEFPGGTAALMKYLGTNIKYPTISQEMGSAGRVIVQFVVDKDGSISNPEVVRGVDAYLCPLCPPARCTPPERGSWHRPKRPACGTSGPRWCGWRRGICGSAKSPCGH